MGKYRNFKVGNTMSNTGGFGFSIGDQNGAPLLTVTFQTEAEAKEAEAKIREALKSALHVNAPGR